MQYNIINQNKIPQSLYRVKPKLDEIKLDTTFTPQKKINLVQCQNWQEIGHIKPYSNLPSACVIYDNPHTIDTGNKDKEDFNAKH